jgi:hypothetical protein
VSGFDWKRARQRDHDRLEADRLSELGVASGRKKKRKTKAVHPNSTAARKVGPGNLAHGLIVLTRALPTSVVWVAVVFALDLPGVMAVAGVVTALYLAWWDRQKEIAARSLEYGEPFERDPFEEDVPIFHDG